MKEVRENRIFLIPDLSSRNGETAYSVCLIRDTLFLHFLVFCVLDLCYTVRWDFAVMNLF